MIALAAILALPAGSAAQERQAVSRPALDGRRLVAWKCNACHRSVRATEVRKSRAEWEATVARMVANGLQARDDELRAIIDYLASLETDR